MVDFKKNMKYKPPAERLNKRHKTSRIFIWIAIIILIFLIAFIAICAIGGAKIFEVAKMTSYTSMRSNILSQYNDFSRFDNDTAEYSAKKELVATELDKLKHNIDNELISFQDIVNLYKDYDTKMQDSILTFPEAKALVEEIEKINKNSGDK